MTQMSMGALPSNDVPVSRPRWCAVLAGLVSPAFPDEATAAMVTFLPGLRHLPDGLFTGNTAFHVARAKRRQGVPSFDEVERALLDYRRTFLVETQPRLAPPREPPRVGPTPEAMAEVSQLIGRWRWDMENDRQARESGQTGEPPSPRKRDLPDVALHGDALAQHRAGHGHHVPPIPRRREDEEA